jgi:hypothetical protein
MTTHYSGLFPPGQYSTIMSGPSQVVDLRWEKVILKLVQDLGVWGHRVPAGSCLLRCYSGSDCLPCPANPAGDLQAMALYPRNLAYFGSNFEILLYVPALGISEEHEASFSLVLLRVFCFSDQI